MQAVRQHEPSRVIVAVPVGAPSTCEDFADIADEAVCARTPKPFSAVGQWYLASPRQRMTRSARCCANTRRDCGPERAGHEPCSP